MQISLEAGRIKLGRVALDGTKIKANAGKHKAMSYDRMQQQEEAIREQVRELLGRAERRQSRLKRIGEAKKAVERRAQEEAQAQGKPVEDAKPEDKDQYNFTDPESRIMKSSEGFVQAYNAQAVVEEDLQLVVGQRVTQAANDKEQLRPMVEITQQQSGQRPEELMADSGYCSEKNLEYLDADAAPEKRIEAFVASGRQKHGDLF